MNEIIKAISALRANRIQFPESPIRIAKKARVNFNRKIENKKTISHERLTEKDVEKIPFYIKEMKPAPEDAEFKFTFAKDINGNFYESTKRLYQEITRYRSIKIGQYAYKISRTDKNLIVANFVG